MKLGVITTIDNYPWAGSEELWWRAVNYGITQQITAKVLIPKVMERSAQIQELSTKGVAIHTRFQSPHHRITSLMVRFKNPYTRFLNDLDHCLISMGSILDVLYLPGLYEALMHTSVPISLLLQFNSDLLTFSEEQRTKIKALYQKSTNQFFVSLHNQHLAGKQLTSTFSNPVMVYNPIKTNPVAPISYPELDNTVQFGYVARFETLWKGFDVILEILGTDKWLNRNWHLNLYGSGPDEYYIQDLIKFYRLEQRVSIHGQVANIEAVWQNNHLKLLATRGEGTPLAVLEAMSCGRPVVTTRVGGNAEVIQDNESGFLAETANFSSFDKALERAWNRKKDWATIGFSAHNEVKKISHYKPDLQVIKTLLATVQNV